jgi:putative transposase
VPATAYFTVDTVPLKELYAIELLTREVHILGVTCHPSRAFVTQVARDLVGDLVDRGRSITFLIWDRDTKLTVSSDDVFRSEDIRVIKTPVRSPRTNGYAERRVRNVRAECLDWMLILSHGEFEQDLRKYVGHCNRRLPHRGIDLRAPTGRIAATPPSFSVHRHDALGGLSREYYRRVSRNGLRGTAAFSPRQNPVGHLDRRHRSGAPLRHPEGGATARLRQVCVPSPLSAAIKSSRRRRWNADRAGAERSTFCALRLDTYRQNAWVTGRSSKRVRKVWCGCGSSHPRTQHEGLIPADRTAVACTSIGADDGIRTRDPHLGKVIRLVQCVHPSLPTCGWVHPVSTESAEIHPCCRAVYYESPPTPVCTCVS